MERMFPRVIVVYNYFDNVVLFEDECIGVFAVDIDVCSGCSSGEGSVERWNLWNLICHIIKETTLVG